ncbi:MAG: response regulator transcription factor [Dehalococcoidales bacterium]|nr:response regulator transcription factor [Dehalococcoidales bacterium]
MIKLLLITSDAKNAPPLLAGLDRRGFKCSTVTYKGALSAAALQPPNLVLLTLPESLDNSIWELTKSLKKGRNLPVIALLPPAVVASIDNRGEIDDFIVQPYRNDELFLRINRLLKKAPEPESADIIRCDGLTIDIVTCEVAVEGTMVDLTFKEYELLKLMARNRGRVFSREALLDKIWGYDYYGGDRTVDVHMRRLRSKIEDASHTYIETVRNIGYRFVKNSPP